MKPLTLYLLRHGESELNFQRVFAGPASDPALTASGAQQAALQAASLKGTPLSTILSSPSRRARQTAQILAQGRDVEIQVSERLREVDIGRLDGQSIDEPENLAVYREVVSRWEQGIRTAGFPGGESLAQVEERFQAFLDALPVGTGIASGTAPGSDAQAPVLVAGHGILFMAALWLFIHERSNRIQDYYMGRCHLTVVIWDGNQLHLERLNVPPQPGVQSESALR